VIRRSPLRETPAGEGDDGVSDESLFRRLLLEKEGIILYERQIRD